MCFDLFIPLCGGSPESGGAMDVVSQRDTVCSSITPGQLAAWSDPAGPRGDLSLLLDTL